MLMQSVTARPARRPAAEIRRLRGLWGHSVAPQDEDRVASPANQNRILLGGSSARPTRSLPPGLCGGVCVHPCAKANRIQRGRELPLPKRGKGGLPPLSESLWLSRVNQRRRSLYRQRRLSRHHPGQTLSSSGFVARVVLITRGTWIDGRPRRSCIDLRIQPGMLQPRMSCPIPGWNVLCPVARDGQAKGE